jgi:hypothetical protein
MAREGESFDFGSGQNSLYLISVLGSAFRSNILLFLGQKEK